MDGEHEGSNHEDARSKVTKKKSHTATHQMTMQRMPVPPKALCDLNGLQRDISHCRDDSQVMSSPPVRQTTPQAVVAGMTFSPSLVADTSSQQMQPAPRYAVGDLSIYSQLIKPPSLSQSPDAGFSMSSQQQIRPTSQSPIVADMSMYSKPIQPTSQSLVTGFSLSSQQLMEPTYSCQVADIYSQQLMQPIREPSVTVGDLGMLSEQQIRPTSQSAIVADMSMHSKPIQPTSQSLVTGFSLSSQQLMEPTYSCQVADIYSQQLMQPIREPSVTVGDLGMSSEQQIRPTSESSVAGFRFSSPQLTQLTPSPHCLSKPSRRLLHEDPNSPKDGPQRTETRLPSSHGVTGCIPLEHD